MKALKKKTKVLLIVVGVVLAIALAVLLFFVPELIVPALWTLLIAGVAFVCIELFFRFKRRKKQRDFDEKITAKEGIEDRKREWGGWIEELDKQGIDRYELPFYMIVGEPQSGKSVLLQNSDLYFPFGQDRLSGVGGTRGCDWWFTDEAVILDIAGRLFTHEGGAADKLEWEAFLDLLYEFRPMCPANGVLLVLPCDALMEDSLEVCSDKANKIQSALLTLTQKLQAQLPVYLVLTKGDKVFGFAESVHRLEAQDRHEMFGWSREATKIDAPFNLDEVREGFKGLVVRARLLRERMIASARIPEALPEIDRMYAFPDELNGLWSSLEVYLRRVFTESNLVDKTAFRGVYLTSGLQTGIPIAKVCGDLLGEQGESDRRGLESLFSHQRAYFIKDLVRNRVFSERGLVRPTQGRVLRARRNAVLGYGFSAAIAAIATGASVWHLVQPRHPLVASAFEAGLEGGRDAAAADPATARLPEMLSDLAGLRRSVRIPRSPVNETFYSTRDSFQSLYAQVFDRRFAPVLRRRLEETLTEKLQANPQSFAELSKLLAEALLLFDDIDFREKGVLDLGGGKRIEDVAEDWLAPNERQTEVIGADSSTRETFSIDDAIKERRAVGGTPAVLVMTSEDSARLGSVRQRLLELLEGALEPGGPWQADGYLGYVVAWKGVEETKQRVTAQDVNQDEAILEHCATFGRALQELARIKDSGAIKDSQLTRDGFRKGWKPLFEAYTKIAAVPGPELDWPALRRLIQFANEKFENYESTERVLIPFNVGGDLGFILTGAWTDTVRSAKASRPIHDPEIDGMIQKGRLLQACLAEPTPEWTLRSIAQSLPANRKRFIDDVEDRDSAERRLYRAKCRELARRITRDLPDWRSAAAALAEGAASGENRDFDPEFVRTFSLLRDEYLALGADEHADVVAHLDQLLVGHLREVRAGAWPPAGQTIDWDLVGALVAASKSSNVELGILAGELCWGYLNQRENAIFDRWYEASSKGTSAEVTLDCLGELNEHVGKLDRLGIGAGTEDVDPDHVRWIEQVDDLFESRLAEHLRVLDEHWTVAVGAWAPLGLPAFADEVLKSLSTAVLTDKIRRANDLEVPVATAKEIQPSQLVATSGLFPKVTAAMTALRQYRPPTKPSDVVREASILDVLAKRVRDEAGLAADGLKLADIVVADMPAPGVTPKPPATAAERYVQGLHEALRERLTQEVRKLYAQRIRDIVVGENRAVVAALYAKTPEEINSIQDETVLSMLGDLLDRDGRLDQLRADYHMTSTAPSLRIDPEAATEEDRDIWEFEAFLVALQRFLLGEEGEEVAVTEFQVNPALPKRVQGTIWDSKMDGFKPHLHYSVGGVGERDYLNVRPDMEFKPLTWAFYARQDERLWFRWTVQVQWQEARREDDVWFELKGGLAPLLLAWMGRKDSDGWFEVSIEPTGSTLRAPLRLQFPNRDLPDRPLAEPRRARR